MSIVVAVKKGDQTAIVADSQVSFGSMSFPGSNLKVEKIRKIGASYFASTGWGLYDDIIENYLIDKPDIELLSKQAIFEFFLGLWKALHDKYNFVNDQSDSDHDSPFGDLDATFLVVNKAGIYMIDSDMSITQFEQYYAIGSGCDYSLGVVHTLYDENLDATEIAKRAVATAIAFDTKCGGDTMTCVL
ncbi:hypothetical protein MNBD_GAMMA22-157 [hydrothermal vent metagenome]|uniref:Uncharacterized protein n=1 Tax=hydrothermal vent metagenome TaxID=652676 RepID=A0A3B1AJC4_9ZZZZ